MDGETMLAMLKMDLGLTTDAYNQRLHSLLNVAQAEIIREGVTDLATASSVSDANLVIMYAGWMWRKRESGEGMPRMVRWALNNRVMQVKMR